MGMLRGEYWKNGGLTEYFSAGMAIRENVSLM
jgi:hypothetical protein